MLDNIKSSYILKTIIRNLLKSRYLNLITHNKNLQKKLNITLENYIKYYYQIEIEIITDKDKIGKENIPFYHIYFNDGNKEIKRNYFTINEKVSKIKVLIDMDVKSIEGLFEECYCIKEVKFINFNRTDFKNYKSMFYYCLNLKYLDIKILKTNNIENMENMFDSCESLEKLDLSNFNTDNVKSMYKMFSGCCSLKELNISNFKFNKSTYVEYMFDYCSQNLKNEIFNKYKDKNINDDAFYDDHEDDTCQCYD